MLDGSPNALSGKHAWMMNEGSTCPSFSSVISADRSNFQAIELGTCWLKTTEQNFKEYKLTICLDAVVLNRQASSRQKQIRYPIHSFQCIADIRPFYSQSKRNPKALDYENKPKYCLLLISSEIKQRSIFCDNLTKLEHWTREIIQQQGFGQESLISQYEQSRLLGKGAFGQVYLSRHVFSGVQVAIKVTSKAKIDRFLKIHS